MPRKHSAGPSGPASAVWLNTTSRITSRPARCSASTIALNSATWPPWLAGPHRGGVAVVRGEEADGVVAPVVRQALRDQERLGHVLVHREQLDGGDAQVGQVRDGGLVAQPGVGPLQLGRDVRVAHGEALDVDLVHHRVRVPVPGAFVVLPAERRVGDQAPGHVPGGVQGGRLAGVGCVLAEHLRPEGDRSADRLGVGVEQQLGRVAPQAPGRVPGAADPVPVGLARADARHEAHARCRRRYRSAGSGFRCRPHRTGTR